jgi:hypothetical protein
MWVVGSWESEFTFTRIAHRAERKTLTTITVCEFRFQETQETLRFSLQHTGVAVKFHTCIWDVFYIDWGLSRVSSVSSDECCVAPWDRSCPPPFKILPYSLFMIIFSSHTTSYDLSAWKRVVKYPTLLCKSQITYGLRQFIIDNRTGHSAANTSLTYLPILVYFSGGQVAWGADSIYRGQAAPFQSVNHHLSMSNGAASFPFFTLFPFIHYTVFMFSPVLFTSNQLPFIITK